MGHVGRLYDVSIESSWKHVRFTTWPSKHALHPPCTLRWKSSNRTAEDVHVQVPKQERGTQIYDEAERTTSGLPGTNNN